MKTTKWATRPISPTCEVLKSNILKIEKANSLDDLCCGLPTSYAYPANGGGWMALCFDHGQKHLPYAKHIDGLILRGETFEGLPTK